MLRIHAALVEGALLHCGYLGELGEPRGLGFRAKGLGLRLGSLTLQDYFRALLTEACLELPLANSGENAMLGVVWGVVREQ